MERILRNITINHSHTVGLYRLEGANRFYLITSLQEGAIYELNIELAEQILRHVISLRAMLRMVIRSGMNENLKRLDYNGNLNQEVVIYLEDCRTEKVSYSEHHR